MRKDVGIRVGRIEYDLTILRLTFGTGQGRPSIMDSIPEVKEKCIASLKGLRLASQPVNASIARDVMLGYIEREAPHVFADGKVKLSIQTVRNFLRKELKWTVRSSTKAGHKLPDDWEVQCKKTFHRMVNAIQNEDIHPSLVINFDQTGIHLIPGGDQKT